MASRYDYESTIKAMLKHKNTLYRKAKNVKSRFKLANKYFIFLGKEN